MEELEHESLGKKERELSDKVLANISWSQFLLGSKPWARPWDKLEQKLFLRPHRAAGELRAWTAYILTVDMKLRAHETYWDGLNVQGEAPVISWVTLFSMHSCDYGFSHGLIPKITLTMYTHKVGTRTCEHFRCHASPRPVVYEPSLDAD